MAAAEPADGNLPIDIDEVPLTEVEAAWQRGGGPLLGMSSALSPRCAYRHARR